MRALFVTLAFALTACAAQLGPPHVYPEAELAPTAILAPIRAHMGDVVFTNATRVNEDLMIVEGYRADGAYRFTVTRQDELWLLTNTERTGPAPR